MRSSSTRSSGIAACQAFTSGKSPCARPISLGAVRVRRLPADESCLVMQGIERVLSRLSRRERSPALRVMLLCATALAGNRSGAAPIARPGPVAPAERLRALTRLR